MGARCIYESFKKNIGYKAIILLLFFSSCATRKVQLQKEKIHFVDKSIIETKSPGDKVFITLPNTPKDRPKAITKRYNGEKGAKTDVTFNDAGTVTSINTDCPEVNEKEERDIAYERSTKEKASERVFNMNLAKLASKTIIWIGLFFSLAWVARAWVKNS